MLKVCGMKDPGNIDEIVQVNPDFMGFIFYPKSPRYVVGALDPGVLGRIPKAIKKVGVFVNEEREKLMQLAEEYHLDVLQLHGNESPAYCARCRESYAVVKAFAMTEGFDFESLKEYEGSVDYFLFDAKTEKYGGSGLQFNWNLLKGYNMGEPYFLSGGIGPEDIENVLAANLPGRFILDINSKVEIEPGLKDVEKVKRVSSKLKAKRESGSRQRQ